MLSLEHLDQLASQHELARAYDGSGYIEEAIDLLKSVVEIKTHVLRADHPSLLVSVKLLANIHTNLAADSDKTPSISS